MEPLQFPTKNRTPSLAICAALIPGEIDSRGENIERRQRRTSDDQRSQPRCLHDTSSLLRPGDPFPRNRRQPRAHIQPLEVCAVILVSPGKGSEVDRRQREGEQSRVVQEAVDRERNPRRVVRASVPRLQAPPGSRQNVSYVYRRVRTGGILCRGDLWHPPAAIT